MKKDLTISNDRRTFLKKLLVGTAATFTVPAFAAQNEEELHEALSSFQAPGDEAYWEMVRTMGIVRL